MRRGGWVWQSSLSERHAAEMSKLWIDVTMRGSRKDSRQPYVEWKGGRYRSDALTNRFDLVGKKFRATVPFGDLRIMTLLDDRGGVFVRLPVLPPWSAQKHDIRVREQLIQWDRAKVISIAGVDDALEAYHTYVASTAHANKKSSDLFARHQSSFGAASRSGAPKNRKSDDAPKIPRGGWIGAEGMDDLP